MKRLADDAFNRRVFGNEAPIMVHDYRIVKFVEYWFSIRKGNIAPRRADFDPMAIPRLLPFTEVYEVDDCGDMILRISGDEVYQRTGGNSSGDNYLNMMIVEQRELMREVVKNLKSCPCGELAILLEGNPKLIERMVEAVTLPLSNKDGSEITKVVTLTLNIELDDFKHNYKPDIKDRYLRHQYLDVGYGMPEFRWDIDS